MKHIPIYEVILRLQGQSVHFHTALGWASYTEERVEYVGLESLKEGIAGYLSQLTFVPAYNEAGNEPSVAVANEQLSQQVSTVLHRIQSNLNLVHQTYERIVEGDLPKYEEIRVGIDPYQVIVKIRQSATLQTGE